MSVRAKSASIATLAFVALHCLLSRTDAQPTVPTSDAISSGVDAVIGTQDRTAGWLQAYQAAGAEKPVPAHRIEVVALTKSIVTFTETFEHRVPAGSDLRAAGDHYMRILSRRATDVTKGEADSAPNFRVNSVAVSERARESRTLTWFHIKSLVDVPAAGGGGQMKQRLTQSGTIGLEWTRDGGRIRVSISENRLASTEAISALEAAIVRHVEPILSLAYPGSQQTGGGFSFQHATRVYSLRPSMRVDLLLDWYEERLRAGRSVEKLTRTERLPVSDTSVQPGTPDGLIEATLTDGTIVNLGVLVQPDGSMRVDIRASLLRVPPRPLEQPGSSA